MLPPRHVYNGTVVNTTKTVLQVKAVYSVPPDSHAQVVENTLPAEGSVVLSDITVADGSARLIANIVEVTVTGVDGKTASVVAPLKVASPTRDYLFQVSADAEGNLSIAEPNATLTN